MVGAEPPAKRTRWIASAIPIVAVLAIVIGAAIIVSHLGAARSLNKPEFCRGWTHLQSILSAISIGSIGDKEAVQQLSTEQQKLDDAGRLSGAITGDEIQRLDFWIGQLIGKLHHVQVIGGSRTHLIKRIHAAGLRSPLTVGRCGPSNSAHP